MSTLSEDRLQILQRDLSYHFQDASLLKLALTHRSAAKLHNQRLEFLGDAALGLVMAQFLYQQLPDSSEGQLSQLRASLVNRQSLAAISRRLSLGSLLVLGLGEQKSGGRERESMLSDAMEAVLGAVFLDGGLDACRDVIQHLYAADLVFENNQPADMRDAKTRLQELMQAKSWALPNYQVTDIKGDEHDQLFIVECRIKPLPSAVSGHGRTRREAEQKAAQAALDKLSGIKS
jgi:ribonuclease III